MFKRFRKWFRHESCDREIHSIRHEIPECKNCAEAVGSPSTAQSWTLSTKPVKHTIPASHGHAAALKAGTSFRLIDLHGAQVIDMSAFVLPFPTRNGQSSLAAAEHFSPSYTLYHTQGQPITIGETLYTNMDRPLLKLTGDTVKTHDMTFMSCFPKLYEAEGFKPGSHRSCASNMLEAFGQFGMQSLTEVKDPFNVFQNTPNFSLKPLNTSKPGDWCEFEVLIDCVVGWSSCPYDLGGFNGGKVTDVMVMTGLTPGKSDAQVARLMEGKETWRDPRPLARPRSASHIVATGGEPHPPPLYSDK